MKTCSRCGTDKPLTDFYTKGDRHESACKECTIARNREWRDANNARYNLVRRKKWLRDKYGLTEDEFRERLESQNRQCAGGCGRTFYDPHNLDEERAGKAEPLVDHDHDTGAVRGLLCTWCNSAIGMAGDDIAGLQKLIDYLRRHADDHAEHPAAAADDGSHRRTP